MKFSRILSNYRVCCNSEPNILKILTIILTILLLWMAPVMAIHVNCANGSVIKATVREDRVVIDSLRKRSSPCAVQFLSPNACSISLSVGLQQAAKATDVTVQLYDPFRKRWIDYRNTSTSNIVAVAPVQSGHTINYCLMISLVNDTRFRIVLRENGNVLASSGFDDFVVGKPFRGWNHETTVTN